MREAFGASLPGASTQFVEPPWKAILSNKGILPLLWAMFPGHPNLLPAYFEDDAKAAELGASYVRKPLYSREGANIDLVVGGNAVDRDAGPYGARRASSARRWRRCRNSTATTPCSAPGSPPGKPCGLVGARGCEPDHQEHLALPAARHRRIGGLRKSLLQLPYPHCPSYAKRPGQSD